MFALPRRHRDRERPAPRAGPAAGGRRGARADRPGPPRRDHPEPLRASACRSRTCPELMDDDPAGGPGPDRPRRSTRSTSRSATSATSSSACGPSGSPRWALVGGLAAVADEFRLNTVIDLELTADESLNAELPAEATDPAPPDRPGGAQQRRPPLRREPGQRLAGVPPDDAAEIVLRDRRQRRRASTPTQVARTGHRGLANMRRPGGGDRRPPRGRERAAGGHAYHRPRPASRVPASRADRGAARARDQLPRSDAGRARCASLVVDDHEVVRQGLVALLDRREAFQVVAEAGTVAEALEQARRFEPDIVVMDVRLPDGSGIEACREIRAELPGDAGRDADQLPRRGGGPVGDRRRRQRLPAQADPGARPRGGARGRRARRVAARPGGHREGPRAGPADRHRDATPTSWPS